MSSLTIALIISGLALLFSYLRVMYLSSAELQTKLITLPTMLMVVVLSWFYFVNYAGVPMSAKALPEEFVYVYHVPVDNGDNILLWASEKNHGHRLYKIPNNLETASGLKKALTQAAGMENGIVIGRKRDNNVVSFDVSQIVPVEVLQEISKELENN